MAKVGSDKDCADDAHAGDDSIAGKCSVLTEKMEALMKTLNEESNATSNLTVIRV